MSAKPEDPKPKPDSDKKEADKKPEDKKEESKTEVKPESPKDEFLDEIYDDYKKRMGDKFDKSLEKLDKKTSILVMKTALSLVEKSDKKEEKKDKDNATKMEKANNPAAPKPEQETKPKNVYIPPNRETYRNTLKSAGGYYNLSEKLENKIKNDQK